MSNVGTPTIYTFLIVVVSSSSGGASKIFPRSLMGVMSAPDLSIFKYFFRVEFLDSKIGKFIAMVFL